MLTAFQQVKGSIIVVRYGMRPQIEFYEVFALTDNTRGTVERFEDHIEARPE